MSYRAAFKFVLMVLTLPVAALESGEPIPVGSRDGRGPFAANAIKVQPLGAANFLGNEHPDLLIGTGRWGRGTGAFICPWSDFDRHGVPVFGAPQSVAFPFGGKYPPDTTVFEDGEGVIHAVSIDKGRLVHTHFDRAAIAFLHPHEIPVGGLPRNPSSVAILPNPDGSWEAILEISDGTRYRHQSGSTRDPSYDPYDGAGIWRGGHPYVSLWGARIPAAFDGHALNVRRLSPSDRDVRSSVMRLTPVNFGPKHTRGILGGSHHGPLHYYRNSATDGADLMARVHAVGADGIALRHPTIHPSPVAYPNADGSTMGVIAGGEGGLYWYRFSGRVNPLDKPVFEKPSPVLLEDTDLYGGSLPVPNVVDWDGDGDHDIVAGNSEGFVLFYENRKNDASPAFLPGTLIEADGEAIHIQPGYVDVQGPGEARWGYVCPVVADWNGDGLPDLLLSDSTARHTVYMNHGQKRKPRLDRGRPLFFDGLNLHGTWRVKPGIARLAQRMAYVALDEQDEFHLYWRIDNFNVADGGKLRLEDGTVIGANFLANGGTGRLKINLFDWDADGATDLIVGTPRHGSVPDPHDGLPQSLGLPGAAVLLLRNVSNDADPVFSFPVLMTFRDDPIFLGQHACGPAVADFGREAGPDVIVAEEGGRFLYYAREHLGTMSAATYNERAGRAGAGTN